MKTTVVIPTNDERENVKPMAEAVLATPGWPFKRRLISRAGSLSAS